MLDYVVKITKDATRCSPADHDALRSRGIRRSRNFADHADRRRGSTTSIAWRMRWASAATNWPLNNRPPSVNNATRWIFARDTGILTRPIGSSPIEARQGVTSEGSRLFSISGNICRCTHLDGDAQAPVQSCGAEIRRWGHAAEEVLLNGKILTVDPHDFDRGSGGDRVRRKISRDRIKRRHSRAHRPEHEGHRSARADGDAGTDR